MNEITKNMKYQSLFFIGLLIVVIGFVYNFSLSDIHNNNNNANLSNNYNHLLVPSYNETSYISEKNKLNRMVYHIDGKENGNCDFENKKKKVMDIHNLCYHDIENDILNENLVPKNLYVIP